MRSLSSPRDGSAGFVTGAGTVNDRVFVFRDERWILKQFFWGNSRGTTSAWSTQKRQNHRPSGLSSIRFLSDLSSKVNRLLLGFHCWRRRLIREVSHSLRRL